MDLTVPQYVCLELLSRRPGMSGAELARAAFVTRQSMHGVLRGLHDRGLLARPSTAPSGRALPTVLTPAGRRQLTVASTAIRAVERQLLRALSDADQARLLDDLSVCAAAFAHTPAAAPRRT